MRLMRGNVVRPREAAEAPAVRKLPCRDDGVRENQSVRANVGGGEVQFLPPMRFLPMHTEQPDSMSARRKTTEGDLIRVCVPVIGVLADGGDGAGDVLHRRGENHRGNAVTDDDGIHAHCGEGQCNGFALAGGKVRVAAAGGNDDGRAADDGVCDQIGDVDCHGAVFQGDCITIHR